MKSLITKTKSPQLPVLNKEQPGVKRPSANVKTLGNHPDWLLVSEVTPRYWAVLAQEYSGIGGYGKTYGRPIYDYRAFIYDSVTEKEESREWTISYAMGVGLYQERIELCLEFYGETSRNKVTK